VVWCFCHRKPAAHRVWPNLTSDLTLDERWWQGEAQDFTHFKNPNHHSPPKGFGQLQSLGLSFDLQANPSQLLSFASAYGKLPSAPDVIIDHMYAAPIAAITMPNNDNLSCMGTPQLDGAQDQAVTSTRVALVTRSF
jgi:hypothetical protein